MFFLQQDLDDMLNKLCDIDKCFEDSHKRMLSKGSTENLLFKSIEHSVIMWNTLLGPTVSFLQWKTNVNILKFSETWKIAVIILNIEQGCFTIE